MSEKPDRLNDIATQWTQVHVALTGQGESAAQAQSELFERYGGAMRRYLLAALRDPSAVDDLTQEFAVALVSGGFRKVRAERGRFRDYVKGVLFRLVRKHWRRQGRAPKPLALDVDLTDPECFAAACDEQFRQSWRDELLARTWEDLALREPTYFTVLHFRAAHPDMRTEDMLEELSPQLGKPLTAQGVRQTLHRARKLFTRLLMQQIAGSLEFPSPEAIHEELRELDLATFVLSPRKE
jgi:DNA-directed RNA polymerase specialized sigma24 family protein